MITVHLTHISLKSHLKAPSQLLSCDDSLSLKTYISVIWTSISWKIKTVWPISHKFSFIFTSLKHLIYIHMLRNMKYSGNREDQKRMSTDLSSSDELKTLTDYHLLISWKYRDSFFIILTWFIWHVNLNKGYINSSDAPFISEENLYDNIISESDRYLSDERDLCCQIWNRLSSLFKIKFFIMMLPDCIRETILFKWINEVLWLYLLSNEQINRLLTSDESLETFHKFIDCISVTEAYLHVIRGIEAWKALTYYSKDSVEKPVTAVMLIISERVWQLLLNTSAVKIRADIKVYIFELLAVNDQEAFMINLGLHWGWWFVRWRNPFATLFTNNNNYSFITSELILFRIKSYFSNCIESKDVFWQEEINLLWKIHLKLSTKGKFRISVLFIKLQYEKENETSDHILEETIDPARLFTETFSLLSSHHHLIYVESVRRCFSWNEIDDNKRYSSITFLMYVRKSFRLWHEYKEYTKVNFRFNDNFLLQNDSDTEERFMPQRRMTSREELNWLKIQNLSYFIKLVYTWKDLAEEVFEFLKEHSELKLKAWNYKTLKCAMTLTSLMKKDTAFEDQIDLAEAESEFKTFTLATDFKHVQTLNSSSAPETAKSFHQKINKSAKEILGASCKELSSTSEVETSSTPVIRKFIIWKIIRSVKEILRALSKKLSMITEVETDEDSIAKAEKAFIVRCEISKKWCEKVLMMSAMKVLCSTSNELRDITGSILPVIKQLISVILMQKTILKNVKGQ